MVGTSNLGSWNGHWIYAVWDGWVAKNADGTGSIFWGRNVHPCSITCLRTCPACWPLRQIFLGGKPTWGTDDMKWITHQIFRDYQHQRMGVWLTWEYQQHGLSFYKMDMGKPTGNQIFCPQKSRGFLNFCHMCNHPFLRLEMATMWFFITRGERTWSWVPFASGSLRILFC